MGQRYHYGNGMQEAFSYGHSPMVRSQKSYGGLQLELEEGRRDKKVGKRHDQGTILQMLYICTGWGYH